MFILGMLNSFFFQTRTSFLKLEFYLNFLKAYLANLATSCVALANITKVPPTTAKDTHFILHDSC